jgi:hypothetical protein
MWTAYLGPAGSWTHQAAIDLFGEAGLVPLARDELFAAYAAGTVERACVPVVTSIVGMTPYMDAVLDLPEVKVIAEYPRMLGYSLLARPGTRQHEITEVVAHPVAFVEARPWLDRVMPDVRRTETVSGGAAAQRVADSPTLDKASVGPRIGTSPTMRRAREQADETRCHEWPELQRIAFTPKRQPGATEQDGHDALDNARATASVSSIIQPWNVVPAGSVSVTPTTGTFACLAIPTMR